MTLKLKNEDDFNIIKGQSPFRQELLNNIFKISPDKADLILSRESYYLEFKLSFNKNNFEEYARSMAGFANAHGGYLVFGIKNRPHLMIGIDEKFEEMDPKDLANYICDKFSPEIIWEHYSYSLNGKKFGLIYVWESSNKPIIAISNSAHNIISDASIYYRYRGATKLIKSGDLVSIMNSEKNKINDKWIKTLKTIGKSGISNVAILDLSSGNVTGPGGQFLIDETLITQLSFIREGEFSEKEGAPTLKLIGNLTPISTTVLGNNTVDKKLENIETIDLFKAFLNKNKVTNPEDYIKHICFESSAYLPIYYFISIGRLTREKTIEIVNNVRSTNQSKKYLLTRLKGEDKLDAPIPKGNNEITKNLLTIRQNIIDKKIPLDIEPKEANKYFRMIRTIKREDLDEEYIRSFFLIWMEKYFELKREFMDSYRRAISYFDKLLYY
jgi:hypothetical protein